MATSVAVLEIFIIGVFAAMWLVLALAGLGVVDDAQVLALLKASGSWSGALTVIASLAVYQLGWLINAASQSVQAPLLKRRIRDPLFSKGGFSYDEVRAVVYQEASPAVHKELDSDLAISRLARSGLINFTLIALALFVFPPHRIGLGLVSLLAAVGSVGLLRRRAARYHEKLLATFKYLALTRPSAATYGRST